MKQTIDKTMVSRAIVTKIKEDRDPLNIQAKHIKGFGMPEKVKIKGNEDGYTPDIAAVYDKETHIYEIELSKDLTTDKWQLLSMYAKRNNGNFYLVVPDYLREPVKKELDSKDINAGIIYFNTN